MEVITFDSTVYKKLEAKINAIFAYVTAHPKQPNEEVENEKNKEKLFNSKEVGEILKISTRTLLRMRKTGEISFIHVGGHIRFKQTDIDNYIENRTIQN